MNSWYDPGQMVLLILLGAFMLWSSRWTDGPQALRMIGRAAERYQRIPELELEGEAEDAAKRRYLNPIGLAIVALHLAVWRTILILPQWIRHENGSRNWGAWIYILPLALLPTLFLLNWWSRHFVRRALDERFAGRIEG